MKKKRCLYDNGSSSDEEEATLTASSRPELFSSLLLGTNIMVGGHPVNVVDALKRTRGSDDDSDDMLTQIAKCQRAMNERRNAETKQALEGQVNMQIHNFSSSAITNGGVINSSSSIRCSSNKITFEEPTTRMKIDSAPVCSKRISYAEVEQLARQERIEEVASFTALSQMPIQRAARESHPSAPSSWDDSEDEWMDKAELVEHTQLTDDAQQAQIRCKIPAQCQSGSSDTMIVKSGARKFNADKTVRCPATVLDLPLDALDHESNGPEHPSCEPKNGCQQKGPLQLAAFDAAAEPQQKGIVGKDLVMQGIPASEVNQACASRLLPHQVIGVQWLWRKYALGQGAILGDGKICTCEWVLVFYFFFPTC